MADSDDEHERGRSRDKFRRERYEFGGDKSKGRSDYREKRSWRDDSDSGRRRPRDDYDDEGGKRRYSSGSGYSRGDRDWSPPAAKRMRRDHWGYPDFPGMMAPYGMRPGPWPMHHDMPSAPHHQMPPAPGLAGDSSVMRGMSHSSSKHVMLTFKQFLAQEDDNIDVEDALSRYNEYKTDFERKQIEEFFEKHKEEDWFISKYHPKQVKEMEETTAVNLKSRLQAFLSLLNSGRFDQTPLSHENNEQIVRLMDAAVILMEGGTEHDLLSLDQKQSSGNDEEGDTKKGKVVAEDAKKNNDTSGDEGEEIKDKVKQEGMDVDSEKTEGQSVGGEEGAKELADSSVNGDSSNAPRPLHLTQSVYIRHIPPEITAQEIVEVCRTIPGYLRIAFVDPIADKGYQRRGWVTYTNECNIKDVSSRLSTTKFGENVQLTCMINRELTRRVKQSSQAACTKKGFHNDIQLMVKLIKFLDEKWKLWEHAQDYEEHLQQNPVLELSQALITEGEEPVAMVTSGAGEEEEGVINDPGTEAVDSSSDKAKVIDQLLWYLRIVHSLDYYNTMLFPSEDSMPHRCGIFTVRPKKTSTLTIEEVSEYIEGMEAKVKPLLEPKKLLSDSDMEKYGMKDAETEVERFIELNTQKLSENKYLCPLSGKKFKGPEFVKKHIFNKHIDKVEAVRQESEFFNNYLRDVDRPMPLEATVNSAGTPKTPGADDYPSGPPGMGSRGGGGGWNQRMMFGRGGFNPGMSGFPPGMMDRGGFRPPSGGRRGRGRKVINYHDLDAPEELY